MFYMFLSRRNRVNKKIVLVEQTRNFDEEKRREIRCGITVDLSESEEEKEGRGEGVST